MSRRSTNNTSQDPSFSAKSRSTREILRRVATFLKPYKWLSVGTMLFALLSLFFSLGYPHFIGRIVDQVVSGKNQSQLPWMILGLLATFLLRDAFNALRILVNNTLEQHIIFDMRCAVYARLQILPVNYFDQRASGDLMTRVIEDVNSVERVLVDGIEQGSVALLSLLIVPIVLVRMSPTLTGVAMIPLPFLAAGALWYTLTAHKRYRLQRQASSAMNSLLMDNLQGIRQIKSFSRQPHENSRFADRADQLRTSSLTIMRVWAVYSPAMAFIASLGTVLILYAGSLQVISGKMSSGQLVAFLFYLGLFYEPVRQLHGLNQLLQSARAAGERVFDILDHTTEEPSPAGKVPIKTPVAGEVVYENVGFAYGPDRIVLKGISLKARPGEVIALVGPTGAGKSTLVNLLPEFYQPTEGSISIDGQNISTLTLESLRQHISIVSQEPFLFNGSIRENILYGNLTATDEQLQDAARAANCHEFISRLKDGYDSRVGERGVKLSVGEKQRVSIARALLKNAPILILDEATASVDTATERLIQEALERLMTHRTSFVIAHRLSTIREADQILVLRDGQIVERGTHEQLMQENGLYHKLAQIQNTTFIEEGFEKLQSLQET